MNISGKPFSKHKENNEIWRVLELFSGIGGMHYAIDRSGKSYEVVAAIDINPVANEIYNHNFGSEKAQNSNILSLTPVRIEQLRANVILMSPPCQPFSRNGSFKDVDDRRADPFVHLCGLLDKIPGVEFILLENVKGFERSQACEIYKTRLNAAGFFYKEYILSPHQYGVPNTRHRYYCVAKRTSFTNHTDEIILKPALKYIQDMKRIGDHVEPESDKLNRYLLKDNVLDKRLAVMDICTPDSINSMCFTKAYTHYAEGTGSVYSPLQRSEFDAIYKQIEATEDPIERMLLLRKLKVRYFTPSEVARLMSFPDGFDFPPKITNKQCYRVLGNSINVLVVSSLFAEM